MSVSKNFKDNKNRINTVSILGDIISFKCGVFEAKYNYKDVDTIINMHNKIMDEKTLKEMRLFINKYCEHIDTIEESGQLGLF